MPPFCRYPLVLKSALKRVRIIIYIYYINTPVFFRYPSNRFPVSGSLSSWGISTAHHHAQGGGIMTSGSLQLRVIDLIA